MFGKKEENVPLGALIRTTKCSSLEVGSCEKPAVEVKEIAAKFGRSFATPKERPSTAGLRDRFRKP